jgi:lysozyme family protein
MNVEAIIDGILAREGSAYTNRAADRGGPTMYGITQRTLSAFSGRMVSADEVAALTEQEARAIYHQRYVTDPGFDRLLTVSQHVGEEVIDTGVNCGVETATRFLQRCLNALNRQAKLYPDLAVDGRVGGVTVAALRAYLGVRREDVLLTALNCLQGARYLSIAESSPAQEENVYGWLAQRVQLPKGG